MGGGALRFTPDTDADQPRGPGPLGWLALVWIAGVLLGELAPRAGLWLTTALLPSAVMTAMVARRRFHAARCWALLAALAVSAAWATVRTHHVAEDDVRRFAGEASQLAEVVGVVEGPPRMTTPVRGALGEFSYKPPGTLAVLRVETVWQDGAHRRASGRLLLKIEEADHRLRSGDRVVAAGWLSGVEGPENPGERDYRAMLADRGIHTRLTLPHRWNWRWIERRRWEGPWGWINESCSVAAARSLRLGMDHEPWRLAFLDALLLGRWNAELDEVDQAFRRVGLAHILSISGAHLSILLLGAWLVARLVVARPSHAAAVVLLILGVYLLAVPPQVPIAGRRSWRPRSAWATPPAGACARWRCWRCRRWWC